MSVIVDIAIILSSIATMTIAVCAVMGLSAWKKQHSGKTKYDVATRLLASIRKYRDAVNHYTMDPLLVPPVFAPNLGELSISLQARAILDKEDNDRMESAYQEIYDDILKSEDLWGDEMRIIFLDITLEARQIKTKITIQRCEVAKKIVDEKLTTKQEVEQVLEKMKLDEAVTEKFNAKVKEAEDYLKPKTRL